MANAIVSMRFSIDVPENVVESIVGRPDDSSDDWYQTAGDRVEEAVKDDPSRFLEYVGDEPDVEVDL